MNQYQFPCASLKLTLKSIIVSAEINALIYYVFTCFTPSSSCPELPQLPLLPGSQEFLLPSRESVEYIFEFLLKGEKNCSLSFLRLTELPKEPLLESKISLELSFRRQPIDLPT